MSSFNWPSVEAKVTHSEVGELIGKTNRGRTVTRHFPDIQFEYTVDGTKYTGTRVGLGRDWSKSGMNESTASGFVTQYPVDSTVSAFYNPGKPDESLLQRRLSITVIQMLVLGAAGAWLGLRLFLPACVSAARHGERSFALLQPRVTLADGAATGIFVVAFFITWIGESFVY
jgi:hypothetical protein